MQTLRTNLKINAGGQYTNYPFNSMCVLNDGTILGAGDDGLFRLCCGDDDNGTAIDAYFIPHTTDFGTANKKRCSFSLFQYYADGNLQLSLTGDDETTIGPYTVTPVSTEGRQVRMVKTGAGLKFRYGKIKVANYEGSNFTIDQIKLNISTVTRSDY